MMSKQKMKIIIPFFLIALLFSCNNEEVNQDAADYCACKENEYAGKTEPGECAKLLQKLKNKYEYLPENQEILALKIADCLAGE